MAENGAAEVQLLEDDGDEEEFEGDRGAYCVGGASSSDGPSVTSPEHGTNEQGGDSTECSSSFADSFCETGDEADFGDLEVNSPFSIHADGGQASALPRKKKVTSEWRNAVRPMLWRCEWLELRMKDLLSQVSKYDSQLALIKQEKELQRAISNTNGSKAESGKSYRGHANTSMERRKRKRHEDTVDTSLYLKKHQILSYFFDKQNKGAQTGDLLIDDDSHGTVGDATKGLLDIVGLPASKEYDLDSKQFMLQKILLKISGIQSRVHRLQERLRKAGSKQAKLASFMDHAEVNVAEKRQRTQKRSFSPENDRYARPQKKKKLNILLEQENGTALPVKPTLSERATDCVKEETQWDSEEKTAERSHAHKKAITVDLLLGAESSLANGHLGDLCKENADDILIDNQGAKEGYQPFENVKHPLEEPPALTANIAETAPLKAGSISEPAEAEKISVPLVKQEQEQSRAKAPALTLVYSGRKWRRQPRPEVVASAAASKNYNKGASETPAENQKAQTPTAAENENAGPKKQKTMDTRSYSKLNSGSCLAAMTPKTGNLSSAAKTPKTGNSSSAAKMPKSRNSSSAAKTPKTGDLSSGRNKQAPGTSSAAAKKARTGNSFSDVKKPATGKPLVPARMEMSKNIPTNMRIEKAILVEVNSRRSQRVRKPKVY
ncbi:uncharacterized protein [Lolium perenne]|uniref:uncharacterized protein n=1 Tax=Lolium perenne TaxID=4522 RepID=UPI0021F5EB22|nr:uncharacterized protein LOC127327580 [Lolium perenne]